jgi:surface antigen
MRKSPSKINLFLCTILLIFASGSRSAQIPVEPNIPSQNAADYVQALQYMMITEDYSIVEKMVGPAYSAVGGPPDAAVTSGDPTEHVRVALEASQRATENNATAYCGWHNGMTGDSVDAGYDLQPPGEHMILTVVFVNSELTETTRGANPKFKFAENPQDSDNWSLLEIDYFHEGFGYGNPYTATLPDMFLCPEIEYVELAPTAAPTLAPQPTKAPILDEPPHDADVEEEKEPWWAFLKNLVPKAQASVCNLRRTPITDGDDNFVQCTEYVAQIRPDALCWLRESGANAQFWDDDAEKFGADIVKVDSNPQVGDIVVFESGCAGRGSYGHVAIVTNSRQVAYDKWMIDIKESNGLIRGAEGTQTNVKVESCMSFIHQPYVGFEDDPQEVTPTPQIEPPPAKRSWWDSILCFLRIKQCN